jgi:hypothetical protein
MVMKPQNFKLIKESRKEVGFDPSKTQNLTDNSYSHQNSTQEHFGQTSSKSQGHHPVQIPN